MFWRRKKPRWLVDPLKVALGSVIEKGSRNLSRSHVRIKYHHESEVSFLPLATFVRHCQAFIRGGRSLDIEHLLVAPVVKQRYAKFFDRLTDWGPAARRAYRSVPAQRRPESRDR
jgi:hypothetical protein